MLTNKLRDAPRYPKQALIVLVAGLYWSGLFWSGAGIAGIIALPACVLLMGSGAGGWLWAGDIRTPRMMALGGTIGLLSIVPAIFVFGFIQALVAAALSIAAIIASGYFAALLEEQVDGVPALDVDRRMAAKIGLDETVLGYLVLSTSIPRESDIPRIRAEVEMALEVYEQQGYAADPNKLHQQPAPLTDMRLQPKRLGSLGFQHLQAPSTFTASDLLPGANRWPIRRGPETFHAWVFEHAGEPRPWVIAIHGYKMGRPWIDIPAFSPGRLHHKFGLNVLMPVLPLHGPRADSWNSGNGYFNGDLMNSVHAVSHAVYDIRAAMAWLRSAKHAPTVGMMGLSLGGYHTAVIAGLENGPDCAIAGIPAVDMMGLLWRHGPRLPLHLLEQQGLGIDIGRQVIGPCSPLGVSPQLAADKLGIFAGIADRIVPPDQPQQLWEHWQQPQIAWFAGGHMSFDGEPAVYNLIRETLRAGNCIE